MIALQSRWHTRLCDQKRYLHGEDRRISGRELLGFRVPIRDLEVDRHRDGRRREVASMVTMARSWLWNG